MWDGFSTRPRLRSSRLSAADGLRTRPTSLLINHVVLEVLQFELRGERDERLGVAEEEVAAFHQTVVEVADHHALRAVVEVDDHVAAEDDVEVAEERDA